jgi:hypothetical protein
MLEGETSPVALATQLGGLRGVVDRGYYRLEQLCLAKAEAPTAGAGPDDDERMLTANEAAQMLNTTPRWLYRHGAELPFARPQLRFSGRGLRRWLERKGRSA